MYYKILIIYLYTYLYVCYIFSQNNYQFHTGIHHHQIIILINDTNKVFEYSNKTINKPLKIITKYYYQQVVFICIYNNLSFLCDKFIYFYLNFIIFRFIQFIIFIFSIELNFIKFFYTKINLRQAKE